MKSMLVTGGCGFIGSNFINIIFKNNQHKIINLDAMYYCANEKNIESSIRNSNNYVFIKGSTSNKDLVENILKNYKIEYVVNFAAQSHVQNSFNNSLQFTEDNIVGTHTLLECCRKYNKIKRFIHVSTDEVYGESELGEIKKDETSILCPTNPYSATKAGAELLTQSYIHSYKMPIIITRGNNVYGPNQYPEKVIPKFIDQLKNNKKITIQGDGSHLRSFLHSYDTAMAFIIILEKGIIGEIYNIGSDIETEISVLELGKKLIKIIKNTEDYDICIDYIEDRPFNDKRYFISNQKLKDLGWEITVNFDEGLKELI
jgi:UDP-glucose 4,6-dehydratase